MPKSGPCTNDRNRACFFGAPCLNNPDMAVLGAAEAGKGLGNKIIDNLSVGKAGNGCQVNVPRDIGQTAVFFILNRAGPGNDHPVFPADMGWKTTLPQLEKKFWKGMR